MEIVCLNSTPTHLVTLLTSLVDFSLQVWIIIPLAIMLFFWYCSIAPLTELVDDNDCAGPASNSSVDTVRPCEPHYSLPQDNLDMV